MGRGARKEEVAIHTHPLGKDGLCDLAANVMRISVKASGLSFAQYGVRAVRNPEWAHVYCAAVLAANTSMRGVEIKHVRRKDVDPEARTLHIRKSKNEGSKRVLPLNADALAAVKGMIERAD